MPAYAGSAGLDGDPGDVIQHDLNLAVEAGFVAPDSDSRPRRLQSFDGPNPSATRKEGDHGEAK
jgi:hypothetical protein